MNNTMEYKGYLGSVEFSEEDGIFFGKLLGIRSLISYEGTNAKDLLDDFHGAVDDYLESCRADGTKPEVPYKGSLNVRLKQKTHQRLAAYALHTQQSMNSVVEEAVEEKLDRVRA